MIKSVKLPLLPGYTFDREIGQTRFHKSTQFEYLKGLIPYLSEADRPSFGGYPLKWVEADTTPSLYPRRDSKELPGWVAYDKQILTFDAYFQEALWEVNKCAYQVRKVKIYYYPEDGTIQVNEPKTDNSGMTQGVFIARQRIRFPKPMDKGFYDMLDFNIGRNVELYGRVFRIVNCDNFTRNFLNRMGIFVGDPLSYPPDPVAAENEKNKMLLVGKKPRTTTSLFAKYLEFDKKRLRFYGYWDDRSSQYGYVHKLQIMYFLCDDTIEVLEEIPPNSGIDSGSSFLKRNKLPKFFQGLPRPGEGEGFTILNVWPTGFLKGRYVVDPISFPSSKINYYKENDLAIGATLNVYGRKVVLVDCDDFTKEFYRSKYGVDTFDKLPIPDDTDKVINRPRELPPWNGFGSYEDSEANCRNIIPIAPKTDIFRFLTKARMGIDSHILRFKAKMVSVDTINDDRSFIISYFLRDNEISIFERGLRNTGFPSQNFCRKREIFKPDQDRFVSNKPETFQKHDLWVGNVVKIEGFKFRLISADEYCHRYMELHPEEFPKSNVKLILRKIRDKLRPIYREFVGSCLSPCIQDYDGVGVINYCNLRRALADLMGDDISEHEVITLARQYRLPGPSLKKTKFELINTCRNECQKLLWRGFERLHENLRYKDPCCTNFVKEKIALSLCKGAKIPIDINLLTEVFNNVEKNDCGEIAIDDLLNFFDTECGLSKPVIPFSHRKQFAEVETMRENNDYSYVDCNCLLNAIGLEEELAKEGHTEGAQNKEISPNQASTLPQ